LHANACTIYRCSLSVTYLWHRGDWKSREWPLPRASGTAARTQPLQDTITTGQGSPTRYSHVRIIQSGSHDKWKIIHVTTGRNTRALKRPTGWTCRMQQLTYCAVSTGEKFDRKFCKSWGSVGA
jgi:hypothetical protein